MSMPDAENVADEAANKQSVREPSEAPQVPSADGRDVGLSDTSPGEGGTGRRRDTDDQPAQLSEPNLSTGEGGIDKIVAQQEEMGQKDLPEPGEAGNSEGAVTDTPDP